MSSKESWVFWSLLQKLFVFVSRVWSLRESEVQLIGATTCLAQLFKANRPEITPTTFGSAMLFCLVITVYLQVLTG